MDIRKNARLTPLRREEMALAMIEAGGRLVKRVKVDKAVLGDQTFALSLIMEFPDAGSIENLFTSDAYAAIAPHREKGFAFMNIVICEDL